MGTVVAMHGIVTHVYSSSLVSVDGYPVKISDTALQTCGSVPPANSDVMLQGTIGANGAIFADIYCFTVDTPTAPGLVEGTIQAIDPRYGTISILGFSAQPSPETRVMDSDGSVLSLGDLKVGDAIALDGAYLSAALPFETLGILRLPGVTASLQASVLQLSRDKLADPIFYMYGKPINTDASTAYIGLTRTQFFAGQWKGYIHCPASLTVVVRINADGSLTALSITETWKIDWCG
jgi:hypothetical protein